MDRIELGKNPPDPVVTARTGPPALDTEAIPLTDDMQIRSMRNPPRRAAQGWHVPGQQITWLIHYCIGDSPYEGCGRQIGGQQDYGIGERWREEPVRRSEVGDLTDPTRRRPGLANDP